MRALFVAAIIAAISPLTFAESASALARQPSRPAAFTDPAQAGPDFLLQGEYAGWTNVPGRGSQYVG
ncbi:MAG TPA: hypothetical protein VKH44_14850, partial [Pirellulaceae bacterium]|nr:hypothetical protein [Pirellulaceae bacterium]